MSSSVVFVIPAYNEGEAVKNTVKSIPKEFDVVCVNDGSREL